MLKKLLRLAGLGNPLLEAARDSDPGKFAEVFCRTEVRFLCLPPAFADGMEAKGATQEQILAYVEKAAADLAARDSFIPFGYVEDDEKRIPVFTDQDSAQLFAQQYASQVKRLLPFQVLTAAGATLVPSFGDVDAVVLDDGSGHAIRVSGDQLRALRESAV